MVDRISVRQERTSRSVVVSIAPLLGCPFGAAAIIGSGAALSKKGFVETGLGLDWPLGSLLRKGLLEARGELTRSIASRQWVSPATG